MCSSDLSSLHRPPSSCAPWGPPRCPWARPSPAREAPQAAPSGHCIARAERAALRLSPPRTAPGAPHPRRPGSGRCPASPHPPRPHRQSRLPWRARRRRRELRRRLAAKVKLPQCSRVNSHGGGGGGARGRPLRLLSRVAPRRAAAAAADPRSPLSWGAERPAGEGRDGAGGRAGGGGWARGHRRPALPAPTGRPGGRGQPPGELRAARARGAPRLTLQVTSVPGCPDRALRWDGGAATAAVGLEPVFLRRARQAILPS